MNCINHSDREKVAFCQVCGRPLCNECARRVGSAVYCEADLAAKIGATGAAPAGVPPVDAAGSSAYADPFDVGIPKPGLAALLGFIPGVGAMYNGQLVKGLIHIAVFAVLVSLADDHGIFGMFVAGWVFYMVIEAYQTAMARRRGGPLPNAFGLNDLGDRLSYRMSGVGPAQEPTYVYTPPSATASASDAYVPPAQAYVPSAASNPYAYAPPTAADYAYAPPAAADYAYAPSMPPPVAPPLSSGVPVGAIWMIVLGVFFFLGTTHMFSFFRGILFWPLFLIGFGIYRFYQRMQYVPNDGSPAYRSAIRCAARRSWWMIAVGVIFLLQGTHVVMWHNIWPFFLIALGVWMILERTLTPRVMNNGFVTPPAATAAPAPIVTPPLSSTGTAIVPTTYTDRTDDEGR